MICYYLKHMLIWFWFVFSVFLWQGTSRGWKIPCHASSETYHVAHFVNYKLHSTLYSTLLIYSVKAYFKRKSIVFIWVNSPECNQYFCCNVNEKHEKFFIYSKDGRNEADCTVFIPCYCKSNIYFLKTVISLCKRIMWWFLPFSPLKCFQRIFLCMHHSRKHSLLCLRNTNRDV